MIANPPEAGVPEDLEALCGEPFDPDDYEYIVAEGIGECEKCGTWVAPISDANLCRTCLEEKASQTA